MKSLFFESGDYLGTLYVFYGIVYVHIKPNLSEFIMTTNEINDVGATINPSEP